MRNFIPICLLILLGGESHGHATHRVEGGIRQVRVQLVLDSTQTDSPDLAMRRIEVQLVEETTIRSAQAKVVVGTSNVVLVGESCSGLLARYPSATDCSEGEEIRNSYGPVLLSLFTGSDGSVSIDLERHKRYRLTVESWISDYDPLCGWSASGVLDVNERSMTLLVVDHCG